MASRVAIVGAGWAGLACAVAAARAGAEVDVFERRQAPGDGPPHVDVMPDMMRSLARLGLAEACVRRGFPYRNVTVTDGAGQLRDEIACIRLAARHLPVALGLLGSTLTDSLLDAARVLGVRTHRSCEVQAISFDKDDGDHGHDSGTCTATDRAVLHIRGRAPMSADLTLLATGRHAMCQGSPFTDEPATEQATWWCGLVHRPRDLDQPHVVLAGLGCKLWLAPLDGMTAGLSLVGDDLQALPDASLSSGQAVAWLRAHGCPTDFILPLSDDAAFLRPVRARAGLRPLPWHRGNALCVGPAAYGLPPHFSQPTAQALEDAVVLGELLASHPLATGLPRAFVQRRQPRVRAVYEVAARAMQWDRNPNRGGGLNELAASMAAAVAAPA